MPANPPDWGAGEEFFGPRHAYRLGLLLRLAPPPSLCLDAACGLGTLSLRLRARGFRPIGMDLDFGAARATRGKGVPAVIGRMDSLPFKTASLPAVFSSETLEHLDDFGSAIVELHRILSDGGALVLSVPANMKYWSAWDDWAGHRRRFDPHTIAHEFEPLKPDRILYFGFPFLLIYEKLFLRRFIQKRAEGRMEGPGGWGILKSLLSGPLIVLFRVNIPVQSFAVGIAAKFVK